MSLSYSGLVNHGKLTLPSVDTWGTNMNILRDPPSSITTRRVNKVGDTSSITSMIDDSGNRACEAIQVYARGVNPFVSVDYGNYGNNGGQLSGGITAGVYPGRSAKLPYPIMRDGAFRPPLMLQGDLLALSRLPRVWTSSFTQPGFADFSRKMRTCGTAENTKEVKTSTLKSFIRPTAVYKIETPISEPFEVKYVIKPTIKITATSGIRTIDNQQQHVGLPTKEIDKNPLHVITQSTKSSNVVSYVDNNNFNPDRYLQDTNAHFVNSNLSSNNHTSKEDNNNFNPDRYLQDTNVHFVGSNLSSNNNNYTSIEDVLDLTNLPVHSNIRNVSTTAAFSGYEQNNYLHDDIKLLRNLPEYETNTNKGDQTIHKRIEYENKIELQRNMPMNSFVNNPTNQITRGFSDHSSRDARLAPKIQPGGFSVPVQIPMLDRMQNITSVQESEKGRMNRIVMENMQNRFEKPSPLISSQ